MIVQPKTETGGKYRFTLLEDYTIKLDTGWSGRHDFYAGGELRARLRDDVLTVAAEYAFDGCSPAFRIMGKWIGTPTPKNAIAAALVHDVLRQFLSLECVPYSRRDTDAAFYNVLRDSGFWGRDVYHGAVNSWIGSLYAKIKGAEAGIHCSCSI